MKKLSMIGFISLSITMINIIIQKIVCRADLSINMAEQLIEDFLNPISFLDKNNHRLFHGYTH